MLVAYNNPNARSEIIKVFLNGFCILFIKGTSVFNIMLEHYLLYFDPNKIIFKFNVMNHA